MVANQIGYEQIEAAEDELPALRKLTAFIASANVGDLRLSSSSGEELSLPRSAVQLLQLGLESLANHEQLQLPHATSELSVVEVADRLNLPFEYVFTMVSQRGMLTNESTAQRHIRYEDFLVLKHQEDALRFLARQSQEFDALQNDEPLDQ